MHVLRTNFGEDPNLGLYGFATDAYCLIGIRPDKKAGKVLKVGMHTTSAFGTQLAGIFCTGNSSGIIAPYVLDDYELDDMKKIKDVLVIKSVYTALGNLVLMNDNGVLLSPLLEKNKKEIGNFFGLPCETATIAGSKLVGSLAIATNKGCLVHPRIRDKELAVLKHVLKVDVDIGTVNFGSPFIKSGIIANSHGFIASEMSSGPELGKMTEALKFL